MNRALIVIDEDVSHNSDTPLEIYVINMPEWRDMDSLEKMQAIVDLQDFADLVPDPIREELEKFAGNSL